MCMTCSLNDEKFASIASHNAEKSELLSRHGCVAVASGQIVAQGCNTYRTYSYDGFIKNSCSCHAEINVLRKCLRRNITGKMNLYIVRLSNSNDDMLSSSPCKECFTKMANFNIKSIIYSENNNILVKQNMRDFKPHHETSGKRAILENRVKQFTNI